MLKITGWKLGFKKSLYQEMYNPESLNGKESLIKERIEVDNQKVYG